MEKTLGGDRINSGKKMKVDLRSYNKSTFNLNKINRTTISAGTLVPVWTQIGLPGDDWDINLELDVLTKPTNGPLFGSMSVELHVYEVPIRLYNSWLHNNKLNIGLKMNQVKLPQIEWRAFNLNLEENLDNQHTNPSSLMAYLGNRGIGKGNEVRPSNIRDVNGLPLLAYWDIYKNYYANKQEKIGAYIHNQETINEIVINIGVQQGNQPPLPLPQAPAIQDREIKADTKLIIAYQTAGIPLIPDQIYINQNGEYRPVTELFAEFTTESIGILECSKPLYAYTLFRNWRYKNKTDVGSVEPQIKTFPLENIDDIRDEILKTGGNVTYKINKETIAPYGPPLYIDDLSERPIPLLTPQEGLGLISYKSDRFNNWLETEAITGGNGINQITAVDTSSGQFELDALILAKKIYNMLNRIQVSGGSYKDWLEVNWTNEYNIQAQSPMYCGGLMKELVFQEVVSNAAADGQPLGTLGGRGQLNSKHKGGKVNVKCREHCILMAVASITPRIDYTQGNAWWIDLKTMDDFHKPALDGIGFQDLLTEEMAWWDTVIDEHGNISQKSVGKQPAWTQYKTDYNVASGNFAIENSEQWMVLARRYESTKLGEIKDLTTIIDPVKFNHIFSETSRDAMNFWLQTGFNIEVRRYMSSEDLPNL